MFAIALLNASLLGASVVSLSGSYAIAEVFGIKHSLHRSWRDARTFHASFAAIVAIAAGIVLLPALPLGTVTTLRPGVRRDPAPSTLVLLLILCNDKQLLGPLTNGRRLNAAAIFAVAVVLALSTMLTITTVFPGMQIAIALTLATVLLLTGGLALAISQLRDWQPRPPASPLTRWQRLTWSAPALELVRPPTLTRTRLLTLALLRGYIALIAALLLLKIAGGLPG